MHFYTLRNKLGFSSIHGKFLSIRWPIDISLQHDWFKFANLRIIEEKAVCHKKPGIAHFETTVTRNDIFRQSHWTKTSRVLRESQLHLLVSSLTIDD